MSRIDNATLQLTLTNQAVTGGRSCKVRVYAVNYNVLRIMSGQTQARKNHVLQNHMVSGLFKYKLQNHLLFGNTLTPLTPSCCSKTQQWLRKTNSGMVKVKWMKHLKHAEMGNPHAYCLTETKRQRLNSDWWMTKPHLLKIQSGLQRKLNGYTDGWS
jgi:hypothetical protein